MHERKIEDAPEDVGKRMAIKAALLGGVAAVALAPKPADAQFGFGGIDLGGLLDIIIQGGTTAINDTIREPIVVTREITETAFSLFRQLGVPSSVIALLNQLLGLTGASGEHSMTLPDRIPGAMEISWPEVAPGPSDERMEQGALTAWATRERVREASTVAAATVAGQAQLARDDAVMVDAANEAAAEGNVTTILLALVNLAYTSNQRQTQQLVLSNQIIALLGDQALREQAGRWLGSQVVRQSLEPVPDVMEALPVGRP